MKRHFLKRSLAAALSCALFVLPLSSCNSLPQSPQVPPDLSSLSDQQLYETVYFQNLDVVEAYPDEETAFAMISPVRRTLYVLSMYDTEIQNGGLCQFFVNSSRSLAPYVEECL